MSECMYACEIKSCCISEHIQLHAVSCQVDGVCCEYVGSVWLGWRMACVVVVFVVYVVLGWVVFMCVVCVVVFVCVYVFVCLVLKFK